MVFFSEGGSAGCIGVLGESGGCPSKQLHSCEPGEIALILFQGNPCSVYSQSSEQGWKMSVCLSGLVCLSCVSMGFAAVAEH